MARTTATIVKSIMETGLEDADITTIINIANPIVTRVVGGEGLTEAVLTDIETFFTAHLIAIGKERQASQEKVGDVWITYQKNPIGFLQSTTFGQMVMFLDSSGKFQSAAKMRASITAFEQEEGEF